VSLDPISVGGGTTSYECLAVGTPLVTLPGEFQRARVTYAFYKKMEMMDCVASTPEEYVELALRLGTDHTYNKKMRDKILAANHVIFEDKNYVREMEDFIFRAVKKARSGTD
ncbi:MAG: hypothetical protein HOC91_03800, partial [Nitrospinaceae bacterium]|nr:hypothetical protein [Nitrospinaceae bacterium]